MVSHLHCIETRQEFVQVGTLQPGEALRTVASAYARQLILRSNSAEVFNLEVVAGHCCAVGRNDFLILNSNNYDLRLPNVAPQYVADQLRNHSGVLWGKYVRNGCEDATKKLEATIVGQVHRINPHSNRPAMPQLGPPSGRATEWFYHEVVVKDGRVYNTLTGPNGLPIDDSKNEWEHSDAINFGF